MGEGGGGGGGGKGRWNHGFFLLLHPCSHPVSESHVTHLYLFHKGTLVLEGGSLGKVHGWLSSTVIYGCI